MIHAQLPEFRDIVDTIVRDEAYDGGMGALTEEQFNAMAAKIAQCVIDELEERL